MPWTCLSVFFPSFLDVIASSLGTDIPVRSFDVIFTSLISIFFCAPAKPDEITLIKESRKFNYKLHLCFDLDRSFIVF